MMSEFCMEFCKRFARSPVTVEDSFAALTSARRCLMIWERATGYCQLPELCNIAIVAPKIRYSTRSGIPFDRRLQDLQEEIDDTMVTFGRRKRLLAVMTWIETHREHIANVGKQRMFWYLK
ncbi:hypothetical protein B0H19DRAFT_1072787 [Mycena capillaripes]|nr:hypothetical protein B0H19DRAFT_1072787 [Mycena capillaripes]